MKKIVVALMFLSLLSLCIYSQEAKVIRPRVVSSATPTPTPVSNTSMDAPPPLPVEDDEILEIETNLVTLPVSVLDTKGRFISDLRQNDFEIFENGIQQQVGYFASIESPFTVVLLLDISPSTKYKINEIQDAAISFVDQLRREDKLVVVTFSNKIDVISQQDTSFHRVRSAIRKTKFGDGTSIYEAVDYAIDNLLGSISGRKAVVVLSDGVDTSSRKSTYTRSINKVDKVGALVYSVRYNTFEENQVSGTRQYSIGASPKEYRKGKAYLRDLTKTSGGRLYEAETIQSLETAFKNISEELRRQYSLGYYPAVDGEDGERRSIKIRVKKANYVVKTKDNYVFNLEKETDTN